MLLTFTAAFILYIYFMSLLYLYLCLYIIWLRTEYYKLVLLLVEFNFGNKAHLKKLDNKTVRYLDTPLKRKDKVKYLGVLFDEKMQWKYQIKNITQKANLKLGKIKAIESFLTPHTKKLLVNALVMPYFHYCSPAWSNAAPFRLSKINKKVVDASVFLGQRRQLLHL